jgi:hypothetical protein
MIINTTAALITFMSLILSPLLLFEYSQVSAITIGSKGAQGYGIGTITCPNGLTFNNEKIEFEVSKNRNERVPVDMPGKTTMTFGDWSIAGAAAAAAAAANSNSDKTEANSGTVYKIQLSTNLHGLFINGFQQHDNICKSRTLNSSNGDDDASIVKINFITISGPCNTKGTTISFSTLDGTRGSFRGIILCNFIRE